MELRKFESGAVRDADADTTRYDLIAPEGLRRLAETYAEGARKYDDHNWRKGMPFSATANHAIRHIFQYLAGMADEDHLAHAAWGLFALMEQEKTHPELDDRYFKSKVEGRQQLTADIVEAAGMVGLSRSNLATSTATAPSPWPIPGWHSVTDPRGEGAVCNDRNCTHDSHYAPVEEVLTVD